MYKKINILLVFIVFLLTLTGCIETKDGLIAKVDGEEITEEQLNAEYEIEEARHIKKFGKDDLTQRVEDGRTFEEVLKDEILDNMIIEKLIKIETDKMDISVSEEELNKKIAEYIVAAGGEKEFDETLKMNFFTRESFKENLKKDLLEDKYREKIMEAMEIKDKEVIAFFKENKAKLEVIRARYILVKTEDEAQKILDRLTAGESFEELAKALSQDKSSAKLGGDLGYFRRGTEFVEFPELEEIAFGLKKDEISDIVKTEIGYYIIKLIDKKDKYEELKDEVMMVLREEKYKQKLSEIRKKYKVKIYND